MQQRVTPVTRLLFRRGGVFVANSLPLRRIDVYVASLLEILAHERTLKGVLGRYSEIRTRPSASFTVSISEKLAHLPLEAALVSVGGKVLVSSEHDVDLSYQVANLINKSSYVEGLPSLESLSNIMKQRGIVDVTDASRSRPLVARFLAAKCELAAADYPKLSLETLTMHVQALHDLGLLTISTGFIDFGDFRRVSPFCSDYGYSRGTPIDRYYLDHFIAEVRAQVQGRTLEIGGHRSNKDRYGFVGATSYETMDLVQGGGTDVAADAHDQNAWALNSLDCVILFNVLEHCAKPWVVIDNLHSWLKRSGRVFCVVPNAQRIHRDPRDYWRIQPDAFVALFSSFEIQKLVTYGNLLAVIASFSGIAAEELAPEELARHDERYPVITCLAARKS